MHKLPVSGTSLGYYSTKACNTLYEEQYSVSPAALQRQHYLGFIFVSPATGYVTKSDHTFLLFYPISQICSMFGSSAGESHFCFMPMTNLEVNLRSAAFLYEQAGTLVPITLCLCPLFGQPHDRLFVFRRITASSTFISAKTSQSNSKKH